VHDVYVRPKQPARARIFSAFKHARNSSDWNHVPIRASLVAAFAIIAGNVANEKDCGEGVLKSANPKPKFTPTHRAVF
jgi:hypothetical protein